jgi:RNA polymerase sigma factor (sigma-70 family)
MVSPREVMSGLDSVELARRWELVMTQRDRALRVARNRTKSRADAEDLAQEALLRAVAVPELHPATVGGLISTIVKNLAVDEQRRNSMGERYQRRLSADDRPVAPVEERICDASEARWLHAQLPILSAADREVLLHRAAGHSLTSIASALGLTYKAVESASARARRSLLHTWRSTLAVLVGTLAAVRRALARAGTALPLLPAVWMLILVVPWAAPPDQPAQARQQGPSRTELAVVVASLPSGVRGVRSEPAPVQPATAVRPDPNARNTRHVAYTGSIGDRRTVQVGAGVDREHDNETFQQTLERCLRNGVTFTVTSFECRDDS